MVGWKGSNDGFRVFVGFLGFWVGVMDLGF